MKHGDTRRKTDVRKLAVLLLCIAVFFSGCRNTDLLPEESVQSSSASATTLSAQSTANAKKSKQEVPLVCKYYDADAFREHTNQSIPYEIDSCVSLAVIPHHTPHMDLLCSLLSSDTVQTAAYDAALVIGPNHSGTGAPIQITGRGYYWETGQIEGDAETAAYFASDYRLEVETDTEMLIKDHSVSVLMPYLAHYLPDIPVTAMLLSASVSREMIENLCEDLTELAAEKKLLVLFSIDFSHYQQPKDAEQCDKETIAAFLNNGTEQVFGFGNEHLDSPQAGLLFLRYAQVCDLPVSIQEHRLVSFDENGTQQAMSYFVFTA